MLRKTLLASFCASALLAGTAPAFAAAQELKSEQGTLEVTTVAQGLEHPWALAFLPDQQGMLVTERPGNLRVVGLDGKLSAPLSGVPKVWAKGQGGLLDVVLSPDFKQDRMVYLSYAEGGGQGDKAGTAVGRGRLSKDLTGLEDFKVILRQEPKLSVGNHFGSRMVFDRDGYLFVTLGENNDRPTAQDLDKLQGKSCASIPMAGCRMTTRSWANPACVRKSGPTANATRKARRSTPGQACSGKTSTAHGAVTKST